MGLTIHYSTALDTRSDRKVRQVVGELRKRALDLPFAEVGEVAELEGDRATTEATTATTPCGGLPCKRGSTSRTMARTIGFSPSPSWRSRRGPEKDAKRRISGWRSIPRPFTSETK